MKKSALVLGLCVAAFPALAQRAAPPLNPFITFTPYHANGIYDVGETVGWTVRTPLGMSTQDTLTYNYTIRENNFTVIKTGTIDLSSGAAVIETALNEPGMVYVRLEPGGAVPPAPGPSPAELAQANNDLKAAASTDPAVAAIFQRYSDLRLVSGAPPPSAAGLDRLTVGAAVAPEKFQASQPRPFDFDSFWAGKLEMLAKIPINPVLTAVAAPKPGVNLYTVKLDSVGSHVQGYLAAPTSPGKHPALVIFQYAGVYALSPETAANRAAEGWLAFDVDSHDMPPDQATGAPRAYQTQGDEDRETSYFLNMYLRDTRALDYIQSRPDWDGKTIVLMGVSMGGQQSLVTAGLNPKRVTALIVDVPSGADFDGGLHGRKTGYPSWPSDDAKAMQAGPYFDTVNFASHIKASALVAMGFIDTTAPPVGILTAFDQIKAPKEAVPMVESDHNSTTPQKQEAYDRRSKEVLDALLHTGTFVPNRNWAKGN